MDLSRLNEELDLLRTAYPDLEHRCIDDVHWVRIPSYPVPVGWFHAGASISEAEVVFQIPTQPGQAPYGFRVRPAITLASGGPLNYTAPVETPWGNDFAQFSWSPLESWTPKADVRAGANMLNFARSFVERLSELS